MREPDLGFRSWRWAVDRTLIGASPARVEDAGLVAGSLLFVADLAHDDALDACFVRSYAAHGTLEMVDVSGALEVDGVVAAHSAATLRGLPAVPAPPRSISSEVMSRPSLATDRVRYAGEPVAVVLARDRYVAEDGAERVAVAIEPLEVVLDPTEAARDGAQRLFEGHDNVSATREYGAGVEDALAAAPVMIEATYRNERLAPTSIEARGILARPEGDGLQVHVSHQAPHRLSRDLAQALGLEPEEVHVVLPQVGGAFGAKSQTFPEYIVVCYLALAMRRPIRWIEDRREALLGATHGRGQNQRIRLGADTEGRIMALDVEIDADIGGYPHTGEFVPSMTGWVMSGPYRIPRLCVRVRSVVTNATPTASYRGAGRPEAAYALERTMDKLARRLGLDPVEVRKRNFIAPDLYPYSSPTGATYDSGRHEHALDTALDLVRSDELIAERAHAGGKGGRLVGVGIASYVERSGGQTGTSEFGSVEIASDGRIVARTGTTSQGQGNATALTQIVASAFEVDFGDVTVIQGDTAQVPEGTGSFASRSIQVGGSALHIASGKVIAKGARRAAEMLEVASEDVSYESGRYSIRGTQRSVSLAEVAAVSSLAATEVARPPQAFPFGTYVAVVEVDPETGEVAVRKLVAVDDCGVVVNPKLVEGQVLGSATQGLGQALYERVVYDEWGQPLTSSLMDYSLPTASEVPEFVLGHSVTPNPNVPLGTKGAGEAGCIGAPPAIVNAVIDAIGTDQGIDLPVTPEKVWRALNPGGDR